MEEVRAQAQPSHGPWLSPEAKAKGLVLTDDGAAGPRNEKEEVSPRGLSDDAQGIEAVWPRQLAGSVHDSPTRLGCAQNSRHKAETQDITPSN
ncbi:hypothetical protein GCM10007972_16970 [Iodidimonas muriae]|uniref:Uncharacterized protein n=1 Tax=Iodidimonas muriae TaxID=261467 RepID=A0ABQ2LDG2_9PROT|nr:hypothetical protein GCM10007972_16970 [Iodidimonas muriae]